MTDGSEAVNLVVFLAGEGMGQGDEALGKRLMGAFLDTLAGLEGEVTHVLCVNGGAHLTVQGSPVLDSLRRLEDLGARVLTCTTCLNHFGTLDQLAVGEPSNMYDIIRLQAQARQVLRP